MEIGELKARLEELETRVAFQEETIAVLNDQLAHQELDLRRLWDANRLLAKQLKVVAPSNIRREDEETPPPHY